MAHQANDVIRATEGGSSIMANCYALADLGIESRKLDNEEKIVSGSKIVVHKRDEAFTASSENVDVESAAAGDPVTINYATDNTQLAVGDVVRIPATAAGDNTATVAFRTVTALPDATSVTLSGGALAIPTTVAGAAVLVKVEPSTEVFINEVEQLYAHQGFLDCKDAFIADCLVNDTTSGHVVNLLD